jgi:glycine cleavage system aminomethyltransferase T
MRTEGPLETIVRRAGGVLSASSGSGVAAHYGSSAGELAVCLRAVGIADRSDLGKLVVTGRPEAVADLVRRVAGVALLPAGVGTSAGAWWCAAGPDRVLVLCEATRRARLFGVLRTTARPLGDVRVEDVTAALSVIAVLGRRASGVLSALGALGLHDDPRSAPPFARVRIAGEDVSVLLQSDRRALLVMARGSADRTWHAIEHAGRPYGISCVGLEAVERFWLVDRSARRAPGG